VCWGAIDDAGYLARNPKVKEALQSRMGGSATRSAVALDALEELLLADRSGVGVLELDWKALNRFLPTANTPKFSELARSVEDVKADENGVEDVRRLLAKLSAPELLVAFSEMLKTDVAGILRSAPEKIDEHRSLYDMGFDSLMGVELATAVEVRFGTKLPVMSLSENPTIASLSARVLAQLAGARDSEEEPADAIVVDHARRIAIRHADGAHTDVIAEVARQLN
jgi:acyl carrier protein